MNPLMRRIGTDTRYLLLGLPLAIVAFCLMVTGFSLGMGTVVIWVGVPILGASLMLARGFADLERRMLPEVLGHPVARPRYRPTPQGAGMFRRLVNPLTNGQSWMDLLYGIVNLPVAVVTFCLTVTWWAGAITGLTYPIYGWILEGIPDNNGLAELLGFGDSAVIGVVMTTAIGLLFAITLPAVIRGAALVQAGLSRAMLTGAAELHEHIDDRVLTGESSRTFAGRAREHRAAFTA
ncbi:sensor domain-containing protein [Planomonospora sp. ID67723]|uniref:sensor domain-containing protein n=1 Tax=Planomonospora sp. ID67723 TaxID=2738134 RepID=UPI0018C36A07|nr:sensor domain-containing protein [Planomonospora sp. ID67723]MBG0826585.1 sensor domain-containing protein [Planomonospora sp. ID67723]